MLQQLLWHESQACVLRCNDLVGLELAIPLVIRKLSVYLENAANCLLFFIGLCAIVRVTTLSADIVWVLVQFTSSSLFL